MTGTAIRQRAACHTEHKVGTWASRPVRATTSAGFNQVTHQHNRLGTPRRSSVVQCKDYESYANRTRFRLPEARHGRHRPVRPWAGRYSARDYVQLSFVFSWFGLRRPTTPTRGRLGRGIASKLPRRHQGTSWSDLKQLFDNSLVMSASRPGRGSPAEALRPYDCPPPRATFYWTCTSLMIARPWGSQPRLASQAPPRGATG